MCEMLRQRVICIGQTFSETSLCHEACFLEEGGKLEWRATRSAGLPGLLVMGIDMDGMTFSEFTSHRLQNPDCSAVRLRAVSEPSDSQGMFATAPVASWKRSCGSSCSDLAEGKAFEFEGSVQ